MLLGCISISIALNNLVSAWRSAFSSFNLMLRSVIKKELATAKNVSVVLVNHLCPEELPECLEKLIGNCEMKACNIISLHYASFSSNNHFDNLLIC
jgi:hypothetical protein